MLRNAIEQSKALSSVKKRVFYTDFTFGFVTEEYPLGLMGCHSLHRSSRVNSNVLQFRPFACVMGPTERQEVYELLFLSSKEVLLQYENFDLQAGYVCGDTNYPLTNAAKTVWPQSGRLLCWPHIKRQALKSNIGKLKNHDFFDTAQKDLDSIHMAQNNAQAEIIKDLIFKKWTSCGEETLRCWFEKEYNNKVHNSFHYSASGVPTAVTNNNSDESVNKVIQSESLMDGDKIPLCIFVKKNIRQLIKNMALSRGNTPIHVHAQGVIQREMLKKASILVEDQEKSKTEPRSTFCTYFILFLTL